MAVDGYLIFIPQSGGPLVGESLVDTSKMAPIDAFPTPGLTLTGKNLFEIEDFSLDIEQTLNIGAQSTGAGAGKITFNPFSITRKLDVISETLFAMSAAGTPFKYVDLLLRKSAGGTTVGQIYAGYRFGTCAVHTVSWSYADELPKETVTFEYGQLSLAYRQQKPDGSFSPFVIAGWDRVRNVRI